MSTLKSAKCKPLQNLDTFNSFQKKEQIFISAKRIQLGFLSPIHNFKFYNMFSITKKLIDELQEFLKILIPCVVVLKTSINNQKTLIKVKARKEIELDCNVKVKVEVIGE
jgi:hypothetical protein